MSTTVKSLSAVALLLVLGTASAGAGEGPWGPGADDASFKAMLKSGFRSKGIATLARLDQDETQAFCSDPDNVSGKTGEKKRAEIEAANLATVKWPSDGVWLGDYKEGEKVAQSGRGLTSTDKADMVNGGNCYNCHQLSPKEISYGTIGPSLYQYGKLRGDTDEVKRTTWAKIWNSKASNACSNMPRAGHMGIVTEKQIKDLMALLLDPASPVNQ
ncbi:sulfur oxidation c-type cytochrome SoxX [Pinisolibacter aquiterrae]|uniref:sulfur oxidation c-type cytochrome SoxX n=1 Tax=Pinisolibacter aquiterrae TaxID=2815579 RepID=UPI001C3D7ED3|nr:sulfur oxidation c-type cytochrome SoxX [Pinisolibacter aquiterrae]MBV5263779.1 sulfur oxidation c-type cytochrome SoxX [Pinisolibacter aquiterrae]MCC8237279.1 sulfur oxidation c-type cytochrome SoxX [Pinisolibacter aquiterrae]